jgi:hypothetical protein
MQNMKCRTITHARLACEMFEARGSRYDALFVTLTYRENVEWRRDHISKVITSARNYCRRRGYNLVYAWVMELTRRGRPHYHLVIWVPKGQRLPMFDKQGWWKHGSTNIQKARNAVGYIAKYASKGRITDRFPKRARIYGSGGLTGRYLAEQRWWRLPKWLRKRVRITDCFRRSPSGGGFFSTETGQYLASPFNAIHLNGRIVLYLEPH